MFTATPWEWHVPVMLAAMKNGKHAATEVPAAMFLDDCWALVEAAEKHRKHCVMMENCNYDRMEMMVFNIVRQDAARARFSMPRAVTCTTCGRSSSSGATKGCGVARGPRSSMETSIRRTASVPSPTASTSIAATASITWSR